MSTITIYKGDERPDLSGTISVDGNPTLAGATVTLTAITVHGTKAVDGASCDVTIDDDADTIEWEYEVQDGDFDDIGTYYIYLTVTYSSGDIQTVAKDSSGNQHIVEVKAPYG